MFVFKGSFNFVNQIGIFKPPDFVRHAIVVDGLHVGLGRRDVLLENFFHCFGAVGEADKNRAKICLQKPPKPKTVFFGLRLNIFMGKNF